VTATVAAGTIPCALAVNPVTNKVYVVNTYGGNPAVTDSGTVTVIDGATNATTTVAAGTNPCAIGANWSTNKIYVANLNSEDVTVIDGATNATTTVAMGNDPHAVAVNPLTDSIYVTNSGSSAVAVINGSSNGVSYVSVGTGPFAIAVNPVTNRIYVSSPGGDSVTVIDGATLATTSVPVGSGPGAIAVNQVTNKVYVANSQDNTVTVIDGATNATASVPVGIQPMAVAINTVTNMVYVADFGNPGGGGGGLTVVDGATNATTAIAVGNSPASVAVNDVTNKIYATDGVSNVIVLDGATNAIARVPVGAGATAVAVNPVTDTVYSANDGGNIGTVSVIDGAAAASGAPSARIVNLSARAQVGTGGNILIPGFVIGGSGAETLLIRGAGPGLAQFGISGFLAQPSLSVSNSAGALVASNTGWATSSSPAGLARIAAQVGAFAFASGSADCAAVVSLPAGAYTVQVSGVNNSTGVALAEIYEVASSGTRLVNISARAQVGPGGANIITGFVIAGTGPEVMLVRADGPTLAEFGVSGFLAQPSLSVFDSAGNVVATNTGWGGSFEEDLTAAFSASVGAFPLPPGSADSAQFVSLAPGAYSMQVSGSDGTTGIALAEAYEAP
jgi:YVTN family beta-propeller protein